MEMGKMIDKRYCSYYHSPLGPMLMAADDVSLVGLWFEGQKHFGYGLDQCCEEKELPIFVKTKEWLDVYFSGKQPEVQLPVRFTGTAFQNEVWGILRTIPYRETVTYGEIAKQLAEKRGVKSVSAQAVGGAVGRNPISIIVPCHRVVGTGGKLTGYAGGLDKKAFLLGLEKRQQK